MKINHNMAALNAHRLLTANSNATSKILERLSSGKRINRAADDAAGMAISEKMDGQIRGLRVASRNALDGVSLIQTAEGALSEVHNILQRMRELSVQGANGTLGKMDRQAIQDEINQLTSEINRIGNTTEFNKQELLKGDRTYSETGLIDKPTNLDGGKAAVPPADAVAAKKEFDFKDLNGADAAETNKKIEALVEKGITINGKGIEFYNSTKGAYSGSEIGIDIKDALAESTNADKVPKLLSDIVATVNPKLTMTQLSTATTILTVTANDAGTAGNNIVVEDGCDAKYKVKLQIGANAHQSFTVGITDMRAEALAITGKVGEEGFSSVLNVTDGSNDVMKEAAVDVTNQANADVAMTRFQDAINKVSLLRSNLGAYQNRLEHTIANIDNTNENLTAALSRIQDTDMALAMSEYTKLNILQQSGTAMLAQANQRPQSILQLLQ